MPIALPLQFLLVIVAGWINRSQQDVIEYLRTENAVLLEQLGGEVPRLTDNQRKRLAVAGKALGRDRAASVLGTKDSVVALVRRKKHYVAEVMHPRSGVVTSQVDVWQRPEPDSVPMGVDVMPKLAVVGRRIVAYGAGIPLIAIE